GATVAVITGRSATTAVDVGGLADIPGVTVEGMYGAERWHDGQLDSPATPLHMRALHDELADVVARLSTDPHVWIEDKRLSLVVHARLTADADAVLATL